MGTEWIAPSITGILTLITAVIAGTIAWRNTRTGAREQRAPDVTEAWHETDRARARMRAFEDLFYAVRGALRSLARLVSGQYPEFDIPADVRAALELQPPPIESTPK